jgi:hypothetical protein
MGNMRRQRRRVERQQIAHARRERRRVIARFAADNGMTYQQALDLEAEARHAQRDQAVIDRVRAEDWTVDAVNDDPESFASWVGEEPVDLGAGISAFRRVAGTMGDEPADPADDASG